MSKQELKKELKNIRQMYLSSKDNKKDAQFWAVIYKETLEELKGVTE